MYQIFVEAKFVCTKYFFETSFVFTKDLFKTNFVCTKDFFETNFVCTKDCFETNFLCTKDFFYGAGGTPDPRGGGDPGPSPGHGILKTLFLGEGLLGTSRPVGLGGF